MRFEMLVDVNPGHARAGAALQDWLRLGLGLLGAPYAEAAWRRAPLPQDAFRGTVPFGRPGQMWADLSMQADPDGDRRAVRALSAPAWEAFLDEAANLPYAATIRLCPLDENAEPRLGYNVTIGGSLKYGRDMPDPVDGEWCQMLAFIPDEWLAGEEYVEPMMAAWLGAAHRCNPCYGEIGDGERERTELEISLPGGFSNSGRNIPRSRHRLRGYGWLTICPQELGDQLGGEPYFLASEAFTEVVRLNAGGYWLRATPTYAGYDMAAVERVYRALAPVLIPGQPRVRPDRPRKLVPDHPRPAEAEEPAPDRGYTRPRPARDPATLPVYTLVSTGEAVTVVGSIEWGWDLLRNGVVYHRWGHNKPDGDRYIKILAELVISRDVGLSVAEWVPQQPDDEGNVRYGASLGNPDRHGAS